MKKRIALNLELSAEGEVNVAVNASNFVEIQQGSDFVWVPVSDFREFLQHLTDWSEQNGIGEDKSDG